MKSFMTRGEAKRLRELQTPAKNNTDENSGDRTTQALNEALLGLLAGKLGVEKVTFHHFEEDGEVVLDKEIKAIK